MVKRLCRGKWKEAKGQDKDKLTGVDREESQVEYQKVAYGERHMPPCSGRSIANFIGMDACSVHGHRARAREVKTQEGRTQPDPRRSELSNPYHAWLR